MFNNPGSIARVYIFGVYLKTICLDYDGTYTDFPELMDLIIKFSKGKSYRVILCTMRYEHERDDGIAYLERTIDAVYFTGKKAKKKFLEEAGERPDIWIDDAPWWIMVNG